MQRLPPRWISHLLICTSAVLALQGCGTTAEVKPAAMSVVKPAPAPAAKPLVVQAETMPDLEQVSEYAQRIAEAKADGRMADAQAAELALNQLYAQPKRQ